MIANKRKIVKAINEYFVIRYLPEAISPARIISVIKIDVNNHPTPLAGRIPTIGLASCNQPMCLSKFSI